MAEKRIVVVGLGLIGGSMAMALQGFEDYEVVGVVRSASTYQKAVERHAADRVTYDAAEELPGADVVILAQDPQGIVSFLEEHCSHFKPGSVIVDVCGIKRAIMDGAQCLPDDVDFIGCHPMAGKEVSGIDNAEAGLFRNTHFIMTPPEGVRQEHVDLVERIARFCQFRDVIRTTPERHDEMIAYTSQLMHIIALSVCDDEELFSCRGFEGGSFRDCTRVAALDVALWTQLFSLNREALSRTVKRLEGRLAAYRRAIETQDNELLAAMLTHSAARKKLMNLEQARGDDVHNSF